MRAIVACALITAAWLGGVGVGPVAAFEPPLFPLSEEQLKALDGYRAAAGQKAFAASPDGRFAARTGLASATLAVREAIKECDRDAVDPRSRCIVIDVNGVAVSSAIQYAQISRLDPKAHERDLEITDLEVDIDTWRAIEGYRGKAGHKAFAMSLSGAWARSWEADSEADARTQALEACNKNARAQQQPCFIYAVNERVLVTGPIRLKSDNSVVVPGETPREGRGEPTRTSN
jgi:hypothetical protein